MILKLLCFSVKKIKLFIHERNRELLINWHGQYSRSFMGPQLDRKFHAFST